MVTGGVRDAYPIVCICGSMKFFDSMMVAAQAYSIRGYIVLMPFVRFSPTEQLTNQDKRMLDLMHFAKIALSDLVYVVNVGGYIGQSTSNEIEFAKKHEKPIEYLVNA